jgi:hypothetical protein
MKDMTVRTLIGIAAIGLCLGPADAAAQTSTVVGLMGGYSKTRQTWKPETPVERVGGLTIGGFAHATTPVGWLSVIAEGAYTRRGGDIMGDGEGQLETGAIRSDYLTMSVHGRASLGVGPARVHFSAGPTIDQLMRSRLDPSLVRVLENEGSTVFAVTAGLGVGIWIGERVFAEVEGRVVEALSDAYSGGFHSVKNRSKELVARVGIPLPRN